MISIPAAIGLAAAALVIGVVIGAFGLLEIGYRATRNEPWAK